MTPSRPSQTGERVACRVLPRKLIPARPHQPTTSGCQEARLSDLAICLLNQACLDGRPVQSSMAEALASAGTRSTISGSRKGEIRAVILEPLSEKSKNSLKNTLAAISLDLSPISVWTLSATLSKPNASLFAAISPLLLMRKRSEVVSPISQTSKGDDALLACCSAWMAPSIASVAASTRNGASFHPCTVACIAARLSRGEPSKIQRPSTLPLPLSGMPLLVSRAMISLAPVPA